MEEVSEKEKWSLAQKLLEFQKNGLLSYGKYLDKELESASQSSIKKAYKKYIENEIKRNTEKIASLEEKLNKRSEA